MKTINRYKALSFFLITAFLLAGCGGTLSQSTDRTNRPRVETRNVVAFTGIVEAMNGTQWTVGGQTVTLDPQAFLDPDITLGDEVKVEANVSADGGVVALKVESSPSVDASSTPDPVSTASADMSSTPEVGSTPETSSTHGAGNTENEISGAVEALTAGTITVNGVTYILAEGFTEIKDALLVGDQVKLHVIVNADGIFTVREIEKSVASDDPGNSNGSDDGPGYDSSDDNSNDNSNDDSDDHSDHNGNDDHSNDDDGENSNSDSGGD